MPTVTMKTKSEAQAKVISISAKCSDCCSASLLDEKGNEMLIHDGYVPGFMPGEHYGDYIMLDIDLETGRILNWKPPTSEAIQEWIDEHDEDKR